MINRRVLQTVAVACFGVALFLGGGRELLAAEGDKLQWSLLQGKMKAEGWKQIGEGVFERQLGPGKVERLGYGKEGLAWTIGELRRQMGDLEKEYQAFPSEQLAKVIEDLGVKIAGAQRELKNMPRLMSPFSAAVAGASCANICYSATADAYALTSTQGVAATATAKFNSTCGYSGDTYAYAYARATLGTTTTTVSQADPKTGVNVTSSATASVNGGSVSGYPCLSNANSSAISSALGISYSTSASNSSCPVPSLSVTILGPTYEYFYALGCRSRTWTASIAGGTAPYTYQWKYNGTVVGTASSYTRSICPYSASFTLDLKVTDVYGVMATDTHSVTVETEIEPGCNPICQ